jgi:hypothetical protein
VTTHRSASTTGASRLGTRAGTRRVRQIVYGVLFCASFSFYLSTARTDQPLSAPPEAGDGHDYDALAFNIWQYQRFGFDWNDPAWRRPYEGVPGYESLLGRHSEYYPTTYRQPAVPMLMAVVYAVTHRSFAAWRVVNCSLMAGAVTIAAATSVQFAGLPAAAVVTALLAFALPLLTLFAHQFMTESLAAFLVMLLAWTWIRNQRTGWSPSSAVGSGLVLGTLMATRSVFILLMPLALLAPGGDVRSANRWRLRIICVGTALLLIGPWWIRNVQVLGSFMPLGTQGGVNMPAGFGPRALRFDGMWTSNPGDGFAEIAALKLDTVTSEVRLAKFRSALATTWIREHPLDALRLMFLHVWQETRPRRLPYPTGAWLLPAAMLAALYFRKSPGIGVILSIVGANILGICLTWSVGGRFMAPVQPILAALVGAAIVAVPRDLVRLNKSR